MTRHQTKLLTAIAGTILAGGCACPFQQIKNSPPAAQSQTPLVVDGAMQLREWDLSTALYANGDTIGGPIGFIYEPAWNQEPEALYMIEDAPLFVGQSLALPITLILTPPWEPIRYSGETVETSYNLMPVLPGEPLPIEEPALPPAVSESQKAEAATQP